MSQSPSLTKKFFSKILHWWDISIYTVCINNRNAESSNTMSDTSSLSDSVDSEEYERLQSKERAPEIRRDCIVCKDIDTNVSLFCLSV